MLIVERGSTLDFGRDYKRAIGSVRNRNRIPDRVRIEDAVNVRERHSLSIQVFVLYRRVDHIGVDTKNDQILPSAKIMLNDMLQLLRCAAMDESIGHKSGGGINRIP